MNIKRFWSKVKIGKPAECWEWQESGSHGYGYFRVGTKRKRAHRIAWELANGKTIPKNMLVCHHCDNPKCCNPYHLFIGTHADNSHDRDAKKRNADLRGSKNGSAKLTENSILKIRGLLSQGIEQKEIAQIFNVDPSTISYINTGKTWKHV